MTKSKLKLMVVDDDTCFLRFCEEVVGDAYDLIFARSGEEAVDQFISYQPDILLLDVLLPGMSGLEVCERVRTGNPFSTTVIIIASALAMENDIKNGYRAGANHYLVKPFDDQQLLELLTSMPGQGLAPSKYPFQKYRINGNEAAQLKKTAASFQAAKQNRV